MGSMSRSHDRRLTLEASSRAVQHHCVLQQRGLSPQAHKPHKRVPEACPPARLRWRDAARERYRKFRQTTVRVVSSVGASNSTVSCSFAGSPGAKRCSKSTVSQVIWPWSVIWSDPAPGLQLLHEVEPPPDRRALQRRGMTGAAASPERSARARHSPSPRSVEIVTDAAAAVVRRTADRVRGAMLLGGSRLSVGGWDVVLPAERPDTALRGVTGGS